jgi:hypothetical protein
MQDPGLFLMQDSPQGQGIPFVGFLQSERENAHIIRYIRSQFFHAYRGTHQAGLEQFPIHLPQQRQDVLFRTSTRG